MKKSNHRLRPGVSRRFTAAPAALRSLAFCAADRPRCLRLELRGPDPLARDARERLGPASRADHAWLPGRDPLLLRLGAERAPDRQPRRDPQPAARGRRGRSRQDRDRAERPPRAPVRRAPPEPRAVGRRAHAARAQRRRRGIRRDTGDHPHQRPADGTRGRPPIRPGPGRRQHAQRDRRAAGEGPARGLRPRPGTRHAGCALPTVLPPASRHRARPAHRGRRGQPVDRAEHQQHDPAARHHLRLACRRWTRRGRPQIGQAARW